jgi:hypothetical protein
LEKPGIFHPHIPGRLEIGRPMLMQLRGLDLVFSHHPERNLLNYTLFFRAIFDGSGAGKSTFAVL